MFGEIFAACLLAYLAGWVLVNALFNRLLLRMTKNVERTEVIKKKWRQELAAAVVDEIEERSRRFREHRKVGRP